MLAHDKCLHTSIYILTYNTYVQQHAYMHTCLPLSFFLFYVIFTKIVINSTEKEILATEYFVYATKEYVRLIFYVIAITGARLTSVIFP